MSQYFVGLQGLQRKGTKGSIRGEKGSKEIETKQNNEGFYKPGDLVWVPSETAIYDHSFTKMKITKKPSTALIMPDFLFERRNSLIGVLYDGLLYYIKISDIKKLASNNNNKKKED